MSVGNWPTGSCTPPNMLRSGGVAAPPKAGPSAANCTANNSALMRLPYLLF